MVFYGYLGLWYKSEKNSGDKLKKKSGVLKKKSVLQDLKFFQGLKQTLISQDLDFQKSMCRLKGRVQAVEILAPLEKLKTVYR